jgi:hypothetical protein
VQLLMFACAESVIIDSESNRATLVHILDDSNVPSFPVVMPYLSAFCIFTRQAGEPDPDARIRVILNDVTLLDAPFPVAFQDQLRTRATARIHGLMIPAPGQLRVEIRVADAPPIGVWSAQIDGPPQSPLQAAVGAPQPAGNQSGAAG